MNSSYYFDEHNRFTIEDYTEKKPFSSFLPGIAGVKGIPLWAFYVNRGQGLCSFGIKNKDNPIMEFFPAYKCYQNVDYTGFRTFIKIKSQGKSSFYEPFSSKVLDNKSKNKMYIGDNELELEETNKDSSLKTNVLYFILPNEKIGALVRKLSVKNISEAPLNIEILDGMPVVIPFGIDNKGLKEIGHTLKAWMSVYNAENKIPFYKLRASAGDTAEVSDITEGHFYLCFSEEKGVRELIKPIIDADVVFGQNTSFSIPVNFVREDLEELYKEKQMNTNKIPAGFFGKALRLEPGESVNLYSLIGHTSSLESLNNEAERFISEVYIQEKYEEAKALTKALTDNINTSTSEKLFDEYCRQTYLDNVLRGGYPLILGGNEEPLVYHVYSRKHGDLERDYNFFTTEPEHFSSGNGNYRDVNQNRRCDIFFNPLVKDFNISTFMNLLQIDGYNPLVINGYKLKLNVEGSNLINYMDKETSEKVKEFLQKPFTLGALYKFIEVNHIQLSIEEDEFIEKLLPSCQQVIDAVHGEGYWSDHWTYNLDLIESYLSIYPDKKAELLFGEKKYTYFDDSIMVKPRSKKYVLKDGKVRQYDAIEHDKAKAALINSRSEAKNLLRSNYGKGEVYNTTLISKLIILAVNKYSLLDPMGLGIEMEGGKPGWDDAMNGLPGLLGSSMADSYELQRLIYFILDTAKEYEECEVKLPIEIYKLMIGIINCINQLEESYREDKLFVYWDNVATLREYFRESVRFGIQGEEIILPLKDVAILFEKYSAKLKTAAEKARRENNDICPTFFHYDALSYEFIYDDLGKQQVNKSNLPYVKVKAFKQNIMPLFLEGIVRGFKVEMDKEKAKVLYNKVKDSSLFDKKLNMYKLNESLEAESIEIGRVRAFTPGWLENETIWLHMEYKYILEVLKQGLYQEFFEEFKKVIVPFFDAEVYGRSTLENCSFIASSANPDESTHGQGFVARLSGAAAEFLSIWNLMMTGLKPFVLENNELKLDFKPILPGWLFKEDGSISFNFLGDIEVTYYNYKKYDTFHINLKKEKTRLIYKDGRSLELTDERIVGQHALDVRNGEVRRIDIYLSEK